MSWRPLHLTQAVKCRTPLSLSRRSRSAPSSAHRSQSRPRIASASSPRPTTLGLPIAEESLVVGITSGALPDEDRKVVEAGLADLVGNVDLADLPAGFAAGTLDGPRGIAPLEDPAVAEALAHELSISDLLAEDLAIPETAVDRDELSLSELLAEDLTIPDAGGAGEAQPSVVKPELPTPDDHPVSEQPSTGSTSGRNGPRGRDDTSLDSAPAADPDPGADAAPAPDTDTDTGDGDGPDTTPSKPTYRQLPEARPGIMRGLRAGWNRPRE